MHSVKTGKACNKVVFLLPPHFIVYSPWSGLGYFNGLWSSEQSSYCVTPGLHNLDLGRWMRILTAPQYCVEHANNGGGPCSVRRKSDTLMAAAINCYRKKEKKNKAGLLWLSDDCAPFHPRHKDAQCGVASCRSQGQFQLHTHKSKWTHIVHFVAAD